MTTSLGDPEILQSWGTGVRCAQKSDRNCRQGEPSKGAGSRWGQWKGVEASLPPRQG